MKNPKLSENKKILSRINAILITYHQTLYILKS